MSNLEKHLKSLIAGRIPGRQPKVKVVGRGTYRKRRGKLGRKGK